MPLYISRLTVFRIDPPYQIAVSLIVAWSGEGKQQSRLAVARCSLRGGPWAEGGGGYREIDPGHPVQLSAWDSTPVVLFAPAPNGGLNGFGRTWIQSFSRHLLPRNIGVEGRSLPSDAPLSTRGEGGGFFLRHGAPIWGRVKFFVRTCASLRVSDRPC